MGYEKVSYKRSDSAVSVNIEGEEIILESQSGNYLSLNPVAADVWEMLKTPRSMDELIEGVVALYEVEEPQCSEDIDGLLADMLAAGIVEKSVA